MQKSDYKIHIVGAGISGLIAATVLEKNGYHPVILEGSSSVGGRIKTDIVEGYQVDHGFQVLLTAYPAAKKYLDFNTLELQPLLPGANIFRNGSAQTIGDAFRDFSLLFPTLVSNVGSISDKLKILKLNNQLKRKKITAIFNEHEKSTHQYLKDFGFSDKIITHFFKPFFSGIFLEPNLETSSRMFEFVYKMFGEGLAVIPKNGMQAIPNQLKENLKNTTFLYNTTVDEVLDTKIILKNASEIESHITLIATEASDLISNLRNQEIEWKSCDTLYFEVDKRTILKPIIGLVADENALINNLFYPTSIATANKGTKELLSVTIIKKHNLSEKELVAKVQEELKEYCAILNAKFLKIYKLKKALPKLVNLQYGISSTETKLKSTIFLAGDHLLNGSLNAAMIAGEKAALGIIQTLEDGLVVDAFTSDSL